MFSAKIFDSRIKSFNVSGSERWLGHFLAPGLLYVAYYSVGGSYLNVFYTDVLKLSNLWGGTFLMLVPIFSKIFDAFTNIIMGRIIDTTRCRQGKVRPWILISGPLMLITGVLLYTIPQADANIQAIWVIVSYNLFFAFAFTMYNMSYMLQMPLATRNAKQRDGLAVITAMGNNMLPGMVISMLFPMVLLPLMGVNQGRWIAVMSIASIIALPAVLLQYYFTRERVTEEATESTVEIKTHTFVQQLKACFASKYWIMIMGIFVLLRLFNIFQSLSMIYYANWVLGTYNDGRTITLINVIGQFPLGPGVFLLWPLVKKFGRRNITMIGFTLAAIACGLCMLQPRNMTAVLTFMFIKSIGYLPSIGIMALLAAALDHVEWLNGFRCDGLSAAIYTVIDTVVYGIGQGIFNMFLSRFGYVPPTADGSWVSQNVSLQNFFVWGFFGVPMLTLLFVVFMLIFFNIEKQLPQIRTDIIARHKAEAEARGEVYVSPEEKAAREQARLDQIAEEKRVEELRAKCAKKGLSFDEEEAKYQRKTAVKKAKAKKR
ncbi:MAG: MFS transporter [Bacteroidales bacterium]|jgi:GPH family glycoside/pentoside/hexuronide:cation symporter|nr:MFS transporter [Bacteroidales bacterium]